jgi:hypothetical protein
LLFLTILFAIVLIFIRALAYLIPLKNTNLPKIVLPYSSQTVNTSYPINQKQEAPLKATVNNNKENLLKKYPQILLLIPLMIIILSKNK